MRHKLKWFFLAFLVCGFVEGASLLGLLIIKHSMMGLTYEMILGDKLSEGHRRTITGVLSGGEVRFWGDPDVGWTKDPQGSFTDRQSGSNGIVRVAAFGDSYTEISGIETLGSINDRLEVVNFGTGGYGLDQTYLRYLQIAPTIDVEVVLIGFMTENANRNLSVFRPFYYPIGGLVFSKPRFKLDQGELNLLENPLTGLSDYRELVNNTSKTLKELGANDHYFDHRPESSVFDFSPTVRLVKLVVWGIQHKRLISAYISDGVYDEQSEAYKITKRIFEKCYAEVLKTRSSPLIVLFPRKVDIAQYQTMRRRVYQPLIDYFDEKGYKFIDLLDAFDEQSVEVKNVFTQDGAHYNDKGNAIVRDYIYSYLVENFLDRGVSTSE